MQQLITTLPELGLAVSQLRRAKGMTQKELGLLVGMGRSTLARFERGQVSEFGSRKLLRLLEVLGHGVLVTPMRVGFTLDDALAQRQQEAIESVDSRRKR